MRPVHETVQTAQPLEQLITRTKIKMIRISEQDLRAKAGDFAGCERFYGRLRADRHEHRRPDRAVRRRKHTCSRAGRMICMLQVEFKNVLTLFHIVAAYYITRSPNRTPGALNR